MKLSNIFTEVFNISQDKINDNIKLSDIEAWDSMTHMILINRIETEFNVQLTGNEIADMQSLQSIKDILVNNHKIKVQ